MPSFDNDQLTWFFIKGYFEGDGTIRKIDAKKRKECAIISHSMIIKNKIQKFCSIHNIESYIDKESIRFYGKNMIKFLSYLYDNDSFSLERKKNLYLNWKNI
mgnify:CR=1 FL=1